MKPTPFASYMMELDDEEYKKVMKQIKEEACLSSFDLILQYIYGIRRPRQVTRRDIARVIAQHSGNSALTGDDLFPESYYV